jgi:transcriptional/translational regulatory protein YebC/TACO1
MFDEKGQIIIDKEECSMSSDDLMMLVLDAGADDFNEEEDSYEILTTPDAFQGVVEALGKASIDTVSSEITRLPQNYVQVTDEENVKCLHRILDMLDEDDDVQNVYHNWDEPDED